MTDPNKANPELQAHETPETDAREAGDPEREDVRHSEANNPQAPSEDQGGHSDDAAGKGPGEIKLPELVDRLSEDTDATASAVLRDEFSKTGVGDLAILYRRLETSKGPAAEECWAKFLELSQALWSNEHLQATRQLLANAQLHMSPPKPYADTIKASIEYADDFIIIDRIGERFNDGDDEGAAALADGLSSKNRKSTRDAIQSITKARRKSRRTAFIAAGVFAVLLVGANVVGFKIIADMARTPPSFALPEFKQSPGFPLGGLPTETTQDTAIESQERDAQAPLDPGATESEAAASAGAAAQAPSDSPTPEMQDTPLPEEGPDETENADLFSDPAQSDSSSEPRQASTPPDSEQIYNCALARRVIAEGKRLSTEAGFTGNTSALTGFETTAEKACANIGVSDAQISQVGAVIPDADIRRIARSILEAP